MALELLGKRPEVLRTYQVMEQNNLYREKVELRQVIEHIDKLTKIMEDMDKAVEGLYRQAGFGMGELVEAATFPLGFPKGIIEYVRRELLETVGKTANSGHSELLSTLNAARIPFRMGIVRDALHNTEQKLKAVAHELKGVKRIFYGELKGTIESMESTFEQLGKDTDTLLEKIPDLERVRDRGWSSIRVIIEEKRQQSPTHKQRREHEVEL